MIRCQVLRTSKEQAGHLNEISPLLRHQYCNGPRYSFPILERDQRYATYYQWKWKDRMGLGLQPRSNIFGTYICSLHILQSCHSHLILKILFPIYIMKNETARCCYLVP